MKRIKIIIIGMAKILIVLILCAIIFVAGTLYQQPYSKSKAVMELELYSEVEFSEDRKSVFIYKNDHEMKDFYKAVSMLEDDYIVYVVDLSWERK